MPEKVYDMMQGWNSLAAELLYATMSKGSLEKELAFFENRIRENGGAALDQTCGTGRHLIPLLQRGIEVHGADISADALYFARKEAETQGVHPILYHQRMEECDIPREYGTIYVASGTFQIIADLNQALATLQRFWNHLIPGGQLLIGLFKPPEVTQGPACNDSDHPIKWVPISRRDADGEIITTLWSESVDLFEQVLLSKRRYDLYCNGEFVKSEVHSYPLRWYCHHEFLMMLEQTGFNDMVTYSDNIDNPATQDSELVYYGARRPLLSKEAIR